MRMDPKGAARGACCVSLGASAGGAEAEPPGKPLFTHLGAIITARALQLFWGRLDSRRNHSRS